VTRLRKNAIWRVNERRCVNKDTGLSCDQTITLTGIKPQRIGMPKLRRIGYRDPETGRYYEFMTNDFELSANTIVALFKERWQVELFFKWIKQNLKIKAFIGNSKNAIMTQIWVALCTCLILAYIKFSAKLDWSLQKIILILQLNLFIRRDLLSLLRGDPHPDTGQAYNKMALI